MTRRIGIPIEVANARRQALNTQLAHTTSARRALAVQPWWAELASDLGIETVVGNDGAPSSGAHGLVVVDVIRTDLDSVVAAILALEPDERVVFAELSHVDGKPLTDPVPAVDLSWSLWQRGISVVDIHRDEVEVGKRTWHFVTGTARRTPPVQLQLGAD